MDLNTLFSPTSIPNPAFLPSLAELRKEYPYCAAFHTLEALHAVGTDMGLQQEMIRKAAVYAYSRSHLRDLVLEVRKENGLSTNPKIIKPMSVQDLQEIVAGTEKLAYLPNTEEHLSAIHDQPSESEHIPDLIPEPAPAENLTLGVQLSLIDEFIEKDPRIKPNREANESQPREDLTARVQQWDDEIVSETLAIVLLKQKRFQKAITMYEKLKLKYPEKSAYFAALIENIKKLIEAKTENS